MSAARGRWLGSRACTHECGGRTGDAGSGSCTRVPGPASRSGGRPRCGQPLACGATSTPQAPDPGRPPDRGPWLPVTPPLPVAERAVASVLQVPEAKGLPKVGQGRNGGAWSPALSAGERRGGTGSRSLSVLHTVAAGGGRTWCQGAHPPTRLRGPQPPERWHQGGRAGADAGRRGLPQCPAWHPSASRGRASGARGAHLRCLSRVLRRTQSTLSVSELRGGFGVQSPRVADVAPFGFGDV